MQLEYLFVVGRAGAAHRDHHHRRRPLDLHRIPVRREWPCSRPKLPKLKGCELLAGPGLVQSFDLRGNKNGPHPRCGPSPGGNAAQTAVLTDAYPKVQDQYSWIFSNDQASINDHPFCGFRRKDDLIEGSRK